MSNLQNRDFKTKDVKTRKNQTTLKKNSLNKTNHQQKEQPVLSDKEKTRIKHQETID